MFLSLQEGGELDKSSELLTFHEAISNLVESEEQLVEEHKAIIQVRWRCVYWVRRNTRMHAHTHTHTHTTRTHNEHTHMHTFTLIHMCNLQEDIELLEDERKLLEYVNDVDHDIEGIPVHSEEVCG